MIYNNGHIIITKLKENNGDEGKRIGKEADKGEALAYEVMKRYVLWHASPSDSFAEMLFVDAYNKYNQAKEAAPQWRSPNTHPSRMMNRIVLNAQTGRNGRRV